MVTNIGRLDALTFLCNQHDPLASQRECMPQSTTSCMKNKVNTNHSLLPNMPTVSCNAYQIYG